MCLKIDLQIGSLKLSENDCFSCLENSLKEVEKQQKKLSKR